MSGGKGGGSPPPPPDPRLTAQAQAAANAETARLQAQLNAVNQVGPYGTVTYDEFAPDRYQQTITLAPEQQALLDQLVGAQGQLLGVAGTQLGNISDTLGQPLNFDGLPEATIPELQDLSQLEGVREDVIDSVYGRYASRLDPQFAQAEEDLLTRLANQGISVNSPAYQRAVESFGRGRNDAYDAALTSAILTGGQELSRLGAEASRAGAEQSRQYGLQVDQRQRALQEMLALRSQPINEITALLGTGGQVGTPQFSPPPQTAVASTDVAGITQNAYNQQLAAYNAQQQARANTKGGIGGLLGTGVQAATLFI